MTRRGKLWLSGIATVALLAVLGVVDREIQSGGGPGIVALELAWSSERAAEILSEWGADGRDAARLSLWLDFPFLVAYGAFFALAAAAVRDAAGPRGWRRLARVGPALVALPIVAAACDVVENAGLLLVLDGGADTAAPSVATAFAIAKFLALGAAQAYVLTGLGLLAIARFGPIGRRSGAPRR